MKHDILVRMSQFNTSGEELKGLRKLFTDIKLRKTDERPVICEKSILLYYLNHDTATNTRDDALGRLADRRQFGLSEYGTFCRNLHRNVPRNGLPQNGQERHSAGMVDLFVIYLSWITNNVCLAA